MPFGDNGLGPPLQLAGLNEPQRRAVVADDGPLLVLVTAWDPKSCARTPRPGSIPGPRSAVYPLHGVGDILRL
jgi:hypothetical protein